MAARAGVTFELGVASGRGLRLVLVSPREHVFHTLPQVTWFRDLDALLSALDTGWSMI